ncbi:MAG TPA: START domain-containing protein [Myxococcota bacterium]|nr:START domain-containing protein [Myxococcota bacterium]HND30915.1 START domain-containing protein [Myxococcota bacterium]
MLMLILNGWAAPPATATWQVISESPVHIECAQGLPWCRSSGLVGVDQATAVRTFEQLDRYVEKMGAISVVDRLEADVLHVVMDYPFPFSDRDYVARFTRRTEADGTEVFAWTSTDHPKAPVDPAIVRLSWSEGEWSFKPEGGHTRVGYLWQSNPGGGIPDVTAVYKQAGYLAIRDIATACGAEILKP